MERIIDIIKSQIDECKNTGDMFEMPPLDMEGVSVIKESIKGDGSTLYHDIYDINLQTGESIHIDYRSKDQCRCYQVRPDRSKIEVTCSNSDYNFNDAWDENS